MDKEIKVVPHYSAPRYETSGAACFDIEIDETYTLNPGELHNFSTGMHVQRYIRSRRAAEKWGKAIEALNTGGSSDEMAN